MLAKWLSVVLIFLPLALFASDENDIELFEFLAMYEQNDNIFIDDEIKNEQNLTSQKVTKSESDEK